MYSEIWTLKSLYSFISSYNFCSSQRTCVHKCKTPKAYTFYVRTEWNRPTSANQGRCKLSWVVLIYIFTAFVPCDFVAPPMKEVKYISPPLSFVFSPMMCFGQCSINESNLTNGWKNKSTTALRPPWEERDMASLLVQETNPAELRLSLSFSANSWANEWYLNSCCLKKELNWSRNWYKKRGTAIIKAWNMSHCLCNKKHARRRQLEDAGKMSRKLF